MADERALQAAKDHFGVILGQQLAKVKRLKSEAEWVDYARANRRVVFEGVGGS